MLNLQSKMLWILFLPLFYGCICITPSVKEVPRIDQELYGNEGYVAGEPMHETSARDTTREVLDFDTEVHNPVDALIKFDKWLQKEAW